MDLETQIRNEAHVLREQLVSVSDPSERVERLAAFVTSGLTTLAAQLDLLRAQVNK
jgi:hypothetical protein